VKVSSLKPSSSLSFLFLFAMKKRKPVVTRATLGNDGSSSVTVLSK